MPEMTFPSGIWRRRRARIALVVFLASPAALAGGLDSMLDGMFTQVTNPGVYKSQSRLGVVGGDVSIRMPVRNIEIASFDPVRLSAGCSGLDLHGGSFGFINAQELIAVMRNIVQGAVAALFKIAISAISPQLSSAMSEFSDALRQLNSMFKNSCRIGEAFVNAQKSDNPGAAFEQATEIERKFEAFKAKTASAVDILWRGKTDPKYNQIDRDVDNTVTGNLVWRAMVQTGSPSAVGNLAGTDASLVGALVMSITGTQVIPTSDQWEVGTGSGCATGAATTATTFAGTSMQVCSPNGRTVAAIDANSLLRILRKPQAGDKVIACNADNSDASVSDQFACQKPIETELSADRWMGTDAWVRKMLWGDAQYQPGADSIPPGGIVGNILSGRSLSEDAALASQLAGFRTPALRYLLTVQRSPDGLRKVAEELEPILSAELSVAVARALLTAARRTYSGPPAPNVNKPADFDANVVRFAQAIAREEGTVAEQVKAKAEVFNLIKIYAQNLPGGALPAPVGLGVRYGLSAPK